MWSNFNEVSYRNEDCNWASFLRNEILKENEVHISLADLEKGAEDERLDQIMLGGN